MRHGASARTPSTRFRLKGCAGLGLAIPQGGAPFLDVSGTEPDQVADVTFAQRRPVRSDRLKTAFMMASPGAA
jgi:hypothetical protein